MLTAEVPMAPGASKIVSVAACALPESATYRPHTAKQTVSVSPHGANAENLARARWIVIEVSSFHVEHRQAASRPRMARTMTQAPPLPVIMRELPGKERGLSPKGGWRDRA